MKRKNRDAQNAGKKSEIDISGARGQRATLQYVVVVGFSRSLCCIVVRLALRCVCVVCLVAAGLVGVGVSFTAVAVGKTFRAREGPEEHMTISNLILVTPTVLGKMITY